MDNALHKSKSKMFQTKMSHPPWAFPTLLSKIMRLRPLSFVTPLATNSAICLQTAVFTWNYIKTSTKWWRKVNTWIERWAKYKTKQFTKEKYKCLTTLVIKEMKCIIKYIYNFHLSNWQILNMVISSVRVWGKHTKVGIEKWCNISEE